MEVYFETQRITVVDPFRSLVTVSRASRSEGSKWDM